MAIGFYYPTKAGATAQWVPSRQPIYPLSEPKDYPQQLAAETSGGTLYVQDKGVQQTRFSLRFERVTETDRDNALTFFTTIKKMLNAFQFEDRDGTLHSVRWMNAFDFSLVVKDRYSAVIELRKEV